MNSTLDWSALEREALEVFLTLLRIDTSNPPGNERPAARYLGSLLEAEGIECEYIETAPNREIVTARLAGDGTKRALLLGSHSDVVPIEAAFWTVPPFEGIVRDGRIYGRGAVDMKSTAVMQLFAMILAKRLTLPLARDLVFLCVPDEEAGSAEGMAWLIQNRADLLNAEFAINEGGSGFAQFGGAPATWFSVAVTEKEICPLRLVAEGRAGHGSKPTQDNSAVELARTIVKLAEWERPLTIDDHARQFLEALVAGGVIAEGNDSAAFERLLRISPDTQAAFQNTLNVTMVNAGIKRNVIPARSEATIDCRLLAGESPESWRQQVVAHIDNPNVRVEFVIDPERPRPARSTWDTALARGIEDAIREHLGEDTVIAQGTSVIRTDNYFVREQGIPAYGFMPCLLSQSELDGFHGNDEFLTVENFNLGLRMMYTVVQRVCAR